jgi:hypothetical protein
MKIYTKQPKLAVFLKENQGVNKKDYEDIFIGDVKNHHRKIKSLFHNCINIPYKNQVDLKLSNV